MVIFFFHRDQCIFTIDPADARDLDDAVSGRFLKMADDGVIRLYQVSVHIADVSFFVKEDTLLDGMASQRATSTYLVDRVCFLLVFICHRGGKLIYEFFLRLFLCCPPSCVSIFAL